MAIEVSVKSLTFPKIDGNKNEYSNPTGNTSRVYEGTYVASKHKDIKLSTHFKLSDFARNGKYIYNEVLIERLEAMFDNFSAIKGISISSAYRTWQPGGYDSMHNHGGAVDIAWLGEDGKKLDAKYIAPAAVYVGFGGVACLEKPDGNGGWFANSLHMDVRDSYKGTRWYGYENDPDGDGWFSSYTIVSTTNKDTAAKAFYDRYNITEADVVAYLGGVRAPVIKKVFLQRNDTTEARIKVIAESFAKIKTAKYNLYCLDTPDAEPVEVDVLEEDLVVDVNKTDTKTENTVSFLIKDLVPGTKYKVEFTVTSEGGESEPKTIEFMTKQDFPAPASSVELEKRFFWDLKTTETIEYKATFDVPSSYDCYWETYWQNKQAAAVDYKGYSVQILINGDVVHTFNANESSPVIFVPSEFDITFGVNMQISVQTWIKTDKTDHRQIIYSDTVCSAPIFLISEIPLVDKMFIKDKNRDDNRFRVMISKLKRKDIP